METQSCNHPFEICRIAEFRRNSQYTKNAKNVVDVNENCEAILGGQNAGFALLDKIQQ